VEHIDYVKFGGSDSRDYCALIASRSIYPIPQRRQRFITIPQRSGSVYIDDGAYDNVEIEYVFKLFPAVSDISTPHEDLTNLVNQFRKSFVAKTWRLNNPGDKAEYYQLTDSYDPDTFRWAAVERTTVEVGTGEVATITVAFNCKPYRYYWDGEKTYTITKPTQIKSVGLEGARPLITIYGSGGTCGVRIKDRLGDKTYTVTLDTPSVDIDSENGTVKYFSHNKSKQYTSAEFPVLPTGTFTVSPTGNTTKIIIKPRWYDI
jgi:phage-related protein